MPPRPLPHCTIVVVAALAVSCSDNPAVAPEVTGDGHAYEARATQPPAGTYEMSFLPTSSGLGVILRGHVEDASGNPAQSGTVTFQYCSLRGVPAPSVNCDTRSGNWARWGSAAIIPSPSPFEGDALMAYDLAPPSGTTIGFRFRFTGRNSGIADGMSAPKDYTFP